MKKLLFVILIISISLVGCENNPSEVSGETPVDIVETQKPLKERSDEELLTYLKESIRVVKNREDFNDKSGELFYYVQKDYLETDLDDEAIKKIVSNYPKEDIKTQYDGIDEDLTRMYPDDVYYDTTTYTIANVHNGILTIYINKDYWMGSPHPYPSFACVNYDLSTGEEYEFPDDKSTEIYDEAAKVWMENAKKLNYEGLLGDYFREDGSSSKYMNYDDETQLYYLEDENVLNEAIHEELKKGSFEVTDEKIKFYITAEYSLSSWADKASYCYVEIDNKWDI